MEISKYAIPDRIHTLITILEMCDSDAHEHIIRIRHYVQILLQAVQEHAPEYSVTDEQINKIVIASSLQDLGKIAVPDEVLHKEGAFNEPEFELYMSHTTMGEAILDTIPDIEDPELLNYCKQICRYHHERYDGSGFPDGMHGDAIPFAAQIVSLAEVFDLLTTDHFYRKRCRPTDAYKMIVSGQAGSFSPVLIRCMEYVQDEMLEYVFSQNIRKEQEDG